MGCESTFLLVKLEHCLYNPPQRLGDLGELERLVPSFGWIILLIAALPAV